MAKILEAGFLNVVATPHPAGVYRRLFDAVAEHPVKFWGEFKAAITKPESVRDDDSFFQFQLIIWLEIDPKEPAIDKTSLRRANFPREGRQFSEQYGVNGRIFFCIFDELNHILSVELQNEEGNSVSPLRLERIFTELFSEFVLDPAAEDVEVTVIPKDDALSYVFGLARLDKVEIFVKRPNQDDITTETHRVMKDLMDQKAKSERRVITRQPKTDGIELSEENAVYARVGALNGHVRSSGLDDDGVHDKRSTKEVPKIVKRAVAEGISFLAALRGIAREIRDSRDQL